MATDGDRSTSKVVRRTYWSCVGIVAIASFAVPLVTDHAALVGGLFGLIGRFLAEAIAGTGAGWIGAAVSLTIVFAVTASLLRRWLAPRRPRLATVLIVLWTVAYLVLTLAVPEAPFVGGF